MAPGPMQRVLARLGRSRARAVAWARRRHRRSDEPHGLVLMYHRVAESSVDPWQLAVSPANFDDQVRTLRQHADVVPLVHLRQHLRTGRQSRPVVAITFDDGYVDNLEAAKPVLLRYEAPATVFVATGFVGRRENFWWDRLAQAILAARSLPAALRLGDGSDVLACDDPRLGRQDAVGGRARMRLHERLWNWLSSQGEARRAESLQRIEQWAGARPLEDPSAWPMSADQLRELAADGLIDLGAHTVGHPRLPLLSRSEQATEITQSRADCQRILGAAPASFAFPNGQYDRTSIEVVRAAGFVFACTSQPDLAWASGDPLQIPRVSVRNYSGEALWRRLRWQWLA
jgi:peptidoglycan/xylan/chitin deacetylase (PgdA/CDA1 family)